MIHLRLHPKKNYKHQLAVTVKNTLIKPVDTERYVGVVIGNKLLWRQYLHHMKNKTTARIGLLRYPSKEVKVPDDHIMMQRYGLLVRPAL
jgi:hypothetical protein